VLNIWRFVPPTKGCSSLNPKSSRFGHGILSSTSAIIALVSGLWAPAYADAFSECDKLVLQARSFRKNEGDKALDCYKKASILAEQITPREKSIKEQLLIKAGMAQVFNQQNKTAEFEKCNRAIIALGEADTDSFGDAVSGAYAALSSLLLRQGKNDEAQQYSKKSNKAFNDYKVAFQKKEDASQLNRLLSDYEKALKDTGESSSQTFASARPLAQFYIAHDQFDKARPLLITMVSYTRNSKNYFDAGAEWDERRRKGEPMEGTTKINVNGKEETAFVIDNRRPSGKLNRGNFVCYLYVLSSVDSKLGKSKIAQLQLNEAKQVYSNYQKENLALLLTSFDAFIAKHSIESTTTTSPLVSLLNLSYD
jgi:tetratricopeptide (TPR) repeat protein